MNNADNVEKLVSLDRTGLHIISEKVSGKLEKKKISPSMITGLEGCSARWAFDTFVAKDIIKEEPDNAARRGSLFHKVMEIVFAEDPENRSTALVKKTVGEVFETEEFADLKDNQDVIQWLRGAINGYYNMGGRPEKVKVASVAMRGEAPKKGLEIFVTGQIGETKRPVLGFIDRVVEDPKADGYLIVEDWKTGAKAKQWNPKTKGDEGLAEQRQQIIYSMLLEQEELKVSSARLIYPVAEKIVDVNIRDKELRDLVVRGVEDTDKKLDVYVDNNTFEMEPNFLCAWCPLVKICPVARVKMVGRIKESYLKQPDPEILAAGVDIR